MISSLAVPGTDSIHFHPINRHSNLPADQQTNDVDGIDLQKIPFTFQLDDIHTNFVQVGFGERKGGGGSGCLSCISHKHLSRCQDLTANMMYY